MKIEEISVGKEYWFEYAGGAEHGRVLGIGCNQIIVGIGNPNSIRGPHQIICEYQALDEPCGQPVEPPKRWYQFWK